MSDFERTMYVVQLEKENAALTDKAEFYRKRFDDGASVVRAPLEAEIAAQAERIAELELALNKEKLNSSTLTARLDVSRTAVKARNEEIERLHE